MNTDMCQQGSKYIYSYPRNKAYFLSNVYIVSFLKQTIIKKQNAKQEISSETVIKIF